MILMHNSSMVDSKKEMTSQVASDFGQYARSLISPTTQVLLVGDTNHFREAETVGALTQQSFWDEIRKTGKKPVFATELLAPEHQTFIDALATGKITKDEFLGYFARMPASEQMSQAERNRLFSGFADMIQSGVRVVGINNGHSMGGDSLRKAVAVHVDIALDRIQYLRTARHDFESDPTELARKMIDQGQSQFEKMPHIQRYAFLENISRLQKKMQNNEAVSLEDISSLYDVIHPRNAEFQIHDRETDIPEKNNPDLYARIEKDDEVIRLIQAETSDPDALVGVSYGGGHMAGFHQKLVRAGVNPSPVIVPYLGDDHFKCFKPDSAICRYVEENPDEIRGHMDQSLKGIPHVVIPDLYRMKP